MNLLRDETVIVQRAAAASLSSLLTSQEIVLDFVEGIVLCWNDPQRGQLGISALEAASAAACKCDAVTTRTHIVPILQEATGSLSWKIRMAAVTALSKVTTN